jgi:hypothetical protein
MPQLRLVTYIFTGANCRETHRIETTPLTPRAGRCGKRGEPMISSNRQARTNPTSEIVTKPTRHLCQKELARRWNLSHRTLERWRSLGGGPQFLKLNGRCLYRIEDIEKFERARLKESTCAITSLQRQG